MLELTFSSNLDWGSYIFSIAKTASKKIGASIRSMHELSFSCGCSVSINLSYNHVWNTVVMSGLVLLVATWNYWISCKNRYAGLLVLHLPSVLNHWLIVEMQPASVISIGITLVDVYLNLPKWSHFLIPYGGLLVILKDCMIFLSPFLDVPTMSMPTVSFLSQIDSGILCL